MLNLRRALLLGFFLSGFSALIYEVVWTQLLTLAFGASIYSFSIMLAAFFLGLGLGGYAAGRYIDKIKDPIKIFSYIEMGIGLSGLLILLFYEKIGMTLYFFYSISGSFYLFMAFVFFLSFLFMVVPAALMGATLPVVSKIYANKKESVGRDIGAVFSFNTFGAIFGSSFAGFIFIPTIGLVRTVVIAALINISVAFMIFRFSKRKGSSIFFAGIFVSFVMVLYMSSLTFQPMINGVYKIRSDPSGEYENHFDKKIIFSGSNAYGTVVVAEEGKDLSLWINNKVDASTTPEDMSTQLLLGYLPMFAYPDAKSVLNIGLGGGFTLGAIEAFNVSTLDVIELNPMVKEATGRYFKQFNGNSLEDSRINLKIADARNYLLTSNEKYDVIVSEPSNLWVSGESSLFTKEFYLIAREHLNENGIFSQWIPFYDFSEADTKVFMNTIMEVFPNSTLWISGTDGIIIASKKQVTIDHEYIAKMLNQNPKVRKDLILMNGGFQDISNEYKEVSPEIDLSDVIIEHFTLSSENMRTYAGKTSLHTDDHPVLEFDTARNFLFLKDKYSSVTDIVRYVNNKYGDTNESIIPVSNIEHQVGDWLFLDFLGVKIKTSNWSRASSGYRIQVFNTLSSDNNGYYKFASFTDDQSFFNIITKKSKLKTFEIDSKDVEYVKNIQRQSEVKELLLQKVPQSKVIEFKKKGHKAFRVEYANGQRIYAMIGWYCEVNEVIYLIEINAFGDSEINRIIDDILCLHESNE
jgi:spermidine synthase